MGAEHQPNLAQDIIDLAWLAADNANFAHSALQKARAAQEQVQATASLGLEGITIAPEVHSKLEADIAVAELEFDLFASMAQPVMRMEDSPFARSKGPIEQPTGDDPGTASADEQDSRLSQAEVKKLASERYTRAVYEILRRADANGTYEDEHLKATLKEATGMTEDQWKHTVKWLRNQDCITTTVSDGRGTVNSITVNIEVASALIEADAMVAFPDDLTPAAVLEARRAELAAAEEAAASPQAPGNAPAPPAATEARSEDQPAAAPSAPAATPPSSPAHSETQQLSKAELKRLARARHTKFLFEVLKRADANGSYHSDNMRELMEAADLSENQWKSTLQTLRGWNYITTVKEDRKLVEITVDCQAVDQGIIKQRIALFPGESTATHILEARRRALLRDGEASTPAAPPVESAPAAAAPPPPARPARPAPSTPPAPSSPSMSGRVRRQLAYDQQHGTGTGPTPAEARRSEIAKELVDIKHDFETLDLGRYQRLDVKARTALGYLDDSILVEGFTDIKDLEARQIALTHLRAETIRDANRELKRDELLDFARGADNRFRPVFNRGGIHYLRNVLAFETKESTH